MDTMSVSLAGMNAASFGVAVVANNVANADSKDYQAKRVDFEDIRDGGVKPSRLRESGELTAPGRSNVDFATELTGLLAFSDMYKVNAKVLEAKKEMLGAVLDMKA